MSNRLFGILCSVLVVLIIAVSVGACAARRKASELPITAGFECDVDKTHQDMTNKGHLTRVAAGTLTLTIDKPSTLKGLSMEWNGDDITIKMMGLSFGIDPSEVPQTALGKCMLDALDSAVRLTDKGEKTSEGLKLIGKSLNGDFEIVSDPETGYLVSLSIPSLRVKATFTNFELTDDRIEE